MKLLSGCGLIIGFSIGVIVTTVCLTRLLYGHPLGQHGSRFPVAESALPTNAHVRARAGTVGANIYIHPDDNPVIYKGERVPVLKHGRRGLAMHQNGTAHIEESVWIKYGGHLYKIGQIDKKISGIHSKSTYLSTTRELSVDESRQITERVTIPEIGFDETFGPFQLP